MTDVAHLPGFSRRNGTLYCEALAVRSLAERFGTPLYLYSRQGLETAAADWLNGIKGTHHRVFLPSSPAPRSPFSVFLTAWVSALTL